MLSARDYIEHAVLTVHRRNGGQLAKLDFSQVLLEPSLGLDSLDLAEIMASIENKYGKSPFEALRPPRTWEEIADFLDTPS